MKNLCRALFIFALLLSGFNLWVTTYGQKILCEYFSDGEVRIGRVSGLLPFFVIAEEVAVGDQVTIDHITAWWLPTQLFWNDVRITHIHAGTVTVDLDEKIQKQAALNTSRLSLSLRHLNIDRLIVTRQGRTLDCGVAGKITYSTGTGSLSGKLRLLGEKEEAVTQLSFFYDAARKNPQTHFILNEGAEGPLSALLNLPSHPSLALSGDLIYDPLTEQTRADVKLATLPGEAFEQSEATPFSLGSTLEAKATIVFEPYGALHVHTATVQTENLDLECEVILGDNWTVESSRVTATLHTPTGSLHANGKLAGSLLEPEWDLEVTSKAITLFERPFQELKGRLRTVGDFTEGELDMSALLYGTQVDIQSGYILEKHESLHLTKIRALTPGGRVDGQLRLFLSNRLAIGDLKGSFEDLSVLAGIAHRQMHGKGDITLALSAKPVDGQAIPGQSLKLEARGKNLRIGPLRTAKGALTATLDDLYGVPTGPITLSLIDADFSTWEASEFTGEMTLGREWSPFALAAKGTTKSDSTLNIEGSYQSDQLRLSTLHGKLLGHTLNLSEPITATRQEDTLSLSPFEITIGQGGVAGSLDITKESSEIDLDMSELPLALVEFLIPDLPMRGDATGSIHLGGDPHAPVGTIALDLHEAHLPDTKPYTGKIQLTLTEGRAAFEAKSPEVEIEFDLPAELSLVDRSVNFDTEAPFDGSINGQGNATSYLRFFVDDISRLDGTLDLDLDFSGTLSQPLLEGHIALRDGLYESLFTGSVFHKMSGMIVADGNRLTLTHLSARDSNKGTITANGELLLNLADGLPFVLDINMKEANLLHLDHAKARASGNLTIAGDFSGAVLAGKMTVDHADIEIPENIPSATYALDVTYINSPPFQPQQTLTAGAMEEAPYPVTLDVEFEIPKTAYLKGRGLNTEWKGKVDVRGTTAEPTLHGRLEVSQGDFIFAGRQLPITSGTATVNGPPGETTLLDVQSQTTLGDTLVTVALKGPSKDLDLEVRSEPNLPLKEVLSRLLFDKEFDEINKWQGLQLAQAVVHVTGGGLAPDIIGRLQRGFGLDRLEITGVDGEVNDDDLEEGRTEGQLAFQVGKYLTRGFFVGISKNIETEVNTFAVEADITKSLKLKGEWADDSAGKVTLKWRRDY